MKRGGPLKRSATRRRQRPTGPAQDTRLLVLTRAAWRCERCDGPLAGPQGLSVHHRTPRGMGGTRDSAANSPANLIALCGSGTTGCHGWVESHREQARADGYLVPRGSDPQKVPVRDLAGREWTLDDMGAKTRPLPGLGYHGPVTTPPVTPDMPREDTT